MPPKKTASRDGKLAVFTAKGQEWLPAAKAKAMLQSGDAVPITTKEIGAKAESEVYDSAPVALGLGALRGATLGLSDVVAGGAGFQPEQLAKIQEMSPIASTIGEVGGTLASSLLPGGAIGSLGKGAASAAGALRLGRAGSAIARGAAEGATMAAGQAVSADAMGKEIDGLASIAKGGALGAGLAVAGMLLSGGARIVSQKGREAAQKLGLGLDDVAKTQATIAEKRLALEATGARMEDGFLRANSKAVLDKAQKLTSEIESLEGQIAARQSSIIGKLAGDKLSSVVGGVAGGLLGGGVMGGAFGAIAAPTVMRAAKAAISGAGKVASIPAARHAAMTGAEFFAIKSSLDAVPSGMLEDTIRMLAPADTPTEAADMAASDIANTVEFLKAKLPQPIQGAPGTKPKPPMATDLETFSRYVKGVTDPDSIFESIRNSSATMGDIETLKVLHPEAMEELKKAMRVEIGKSEKSLTPAQLNQASMILDVGPALELSKSMERIWQEREAQKSTGAPNLTNGSATRLQQIMGG